MKISLQKLHSSFSLPYQKRHEDTETSVFIVTFCLLFCAKSLNIGDMCPTEHQMSKRH